MNIISSNTLLKNYQLTEKLFANFLNPLGNEFFVCITRIPLIYENSCNIQYIQSNKNFRNNFIQDIRDF